MDRVLVQILSGGSIPGSLLYTFVHRQIDPKGFRSAPHSKDIQYSEVLAILNRDSQLKPVNMQAKYYADLNNRAISLG